MSTEQTTDITTTTTTTAPSTKKVYVSRFSTEYAAIVESLRTMEEQFNATKKAILTRMRDLQTKVTKLEKESDKIHARQAKRQRTSDPAQSFVGVNLPKRVNGDLLTFLQQNKEKLDEKLREKIQTFMSLNEVNQCILQLSKQNGVIVDNKYSFRNPNANAAFVASVHRLLVEICPAGFYATNINFESQIETRKMSSYFNHLLSRDAESEAYVATCVEAKKRAAVDAAPADVPAPAVDAPAPAAAVAEPEPASKKRRIVRKPTDKTTAVASE